MLRTFMFVQHFACASYDLAGQSRKLGNFDPVASVSCSWRDLAQKNNPSRVLFDRDVEVLDSFQALEFRQLVIMGREEGFRAAGGMNVFHHCPGDSQAVIRSGAAAD